MGHGSGIGGPSRTEGTPHPGGIRDPDTRCGRHDGRGFGSLAADCSGCRLQRSHRLRWTRWANADSRILHYRVSDWGGRRHWAGPKGPAVGEWRPSIGELRAWARQGSGCGGGAVGQGPSPTCVEGHRTDLSLRAKFKGLAGWTAPSKRSSASTAGESEALLDVAARTPPAWHGRRRALAQNWASSVDPCSAVTDELPPWIVVVTSSK